MGIRSWWRDLTSTAAELDAQELREDVVEAGATAINTIEQGQIQTLKGTIQSVVFRPQMSVPQLEAEFFDGSGHIVLVWMGRRKIRGINPGTRIKRLLCLWFFGSNPTSRCNSRAVSSRFADMVINSTLFGRYDRSCLSLLARLRVLLPLPNN